MTFLTFKDKDTCAEALEDEVATILQDAINTRGKASLVVSGGSTPKPFFAALKQRNLPWGQVYITLADERWVDNTHADSNEKLVREHLLAAGAHFVPLKNAAATPHEGAAYASVAIAAMPQPFDVVILGMGDDGHTASFFPHAPELGEALAPKHTDILCAGLTPPSYAPHKRITLTLPALLNAQKIIIHVTGENKKTVYEAALKEGDAAEMPARAVLRQSQTLTEIYWAA